MVDRKSGLRVGAGFGLAALAMLAACSAEPEEAAGSETIVADIPVNGERVFPESVAADSSGNLYLGSTGGTIYRALAGSGSAEPWIAPDETNGLTSLFGILPDETRGVLWVCNNPGFGGPPDPDAVSQLKAFDLATGELSASYDFPAGAPAACNDIAIGADGKVWASETSGGRIFTLADGADSLELFAEGEELVGIDGIAFAEDGTLYINNVRQNLVQRVERGEDGAYAGLTDLALSQPVEGPDALRPLGGSTFIQAEGPAGRVALVEIDGDAATVTTLQEGLDGTPGATAFGDVLYVPESKVNYLFDPALAGQDPGAFVIRAFTLPEAP